MSNEKVISMVPESGQIWRTIAAGDEFLILAIDGEHAYCALLWEDTKPSACPQLRMPIARLRSWGNRGFAYDRKYKGKKLPAVSVTAGDYNARRANYGAR